MDKKSKMLAFAKSQHIRRPFWNSYLFGIRLELNELPNIIQSNEKILAIAPCVYNGHRSMIAVTSARVIVMNRGIFGRFSNNSRTQIYYNEISGSDTSGGYFSSYIVQVPGDGNDISVHRLWGSDSDRIDHAFSTARERYSGHRQANNLTHQSAGPVADVSTQLSRLDTMLKNKQITNQEYDTLRQQIINGN